MALTPSSTAAYRDRIYIVKDLIMKLVEWGELNQTALISFCGLNMKAHKPILEVMEGNGLIQKRSEAIGKKIVGIYSPTEKGIQFCTEILEPYEKMFPRRNEKPRFRKSTLLTRPGIPAD